MKKIALFATLLCLIGCMSLYAQGGTEDVTLDAAHHGTTKSTTSGTIIFLYDEGGPNGPYTGGSDYFMSFTGDCESLDSTHSTHLSIIIHAGYDIGCEDTLYVYDGPDTNSPVLVKFNNCFTSAEGSLFTITPDNYLTRGGVLTVRFRTHLNEERHAGFFCEFECRKPCESIVAYIDKEYDRTDKHGTILRTDTTRLVPQSFDTVFLKDTIVVNDTVWEDSTSFVLVPRDSIFNTDSVISIDTVGWVESAFLCQGQGIILHGHAEYSNRTGWYTPADSTSMFQWDFTIDSLYEIGATAPLYTKFHTVDCYEITLNVIDEHGCKSNVVPSIQVRLAQNPIKTIYDLNPICSSDSLRVNIGYDGDNGTLTLKKIEQSTKAHKVNEVRTFIPDGPNCPKLCYYAPVTFNEFPAGRKVNSANDICSICINYEHSFMGDYSLAVCCPIWDENDDNSPGRAFLKHKDATGGVWPGTGGGSGTFTGMPFLIGGSDGSADGMGNGDVCDSARNPYGTGFNYCFSRNGNYMLVNSDPADISPLPTNTGIAALDYISSVTLNQPAIPTGFYNAGQHGGPVTHNVKDSSDYFNQEKYYSPASDFSELIGCPLNGNWQVEICDKWAIDNGWVFNWSMDICGVSMGGGCTYQVGIDSVTWVPETNYVTDFRNGVYCGLKIHQKVNDPTVSYISSPDTSGDFNIWIHIYDEFGCRWDTLTHISSVYSPTPNLGNDTVLCGVNTIILDGSDKHTTPGISSFLWEPTGDTTKNIETIGGRYQTTTYVVQAINRDKGATCRGRDTIVISVNEQPIPSFDPGIYPLEGCEPFTINIQNTTKYGYKYRWVFGDGTYSTLREPSHSYGAGVYDLKYYVESDKGCKDSLLFPNLITVFSSPVASFNWEPVYPTVQHPSVTLLNTTTPDNGDNKYFWEIQYGENPYSFQTLTAKSPTYQWSASSPDEDISGSYAVRLIARTDNYGPSGHLIQCTDTVESKVVIINDQLKFPSVVTPNGDGINDVFIIANLVEGMAFPINTLDIYDKWGSRVFHASNISQHDQFWDPSRNNIPAGTYFYRFSGKGYQGNIEHNGVVEVVK